MSLIGSDHLFRSNSLITCHESDAGCQAGRQALVRQRRAGAGTTSGIQVPVSLTSPANAPTVMTPSSAQCLHPGGPWNSGRDPIPTCPEASSSLRGSLGSPQVAPCIQTPWKHCPRPAPGLGPVPLLPPAPRGRTTNKQAGTVREPNIQSPFARRTHPLGILERGPRGHGLDGLPGSAGPAACRHQAGGTQLPLQRALTHPTGKRTDGETQPLSPGPWSCAQGGLLPSGAHQAASCCASNRGLPFPASYRPWS